MHPAHPLTPPPLARKFFASHPALKKGENARCDSEREEQDAIRPQPACAERDPHGSAKAFWVVPGFVSSFLSCAPSPSLAGARTNKLGRIHRPHTSDATGSGRRGAGPPVFSAGPLPHPRRPTNGSGIVTATCPPWRQTSETTTRGLYGATATTTPPLHWTPEPLGREKRLTRRVGLPDPFATEETL